MSLMCLAYIFDMLFTSISTTRHWLMYGRLVQEVNVCTVRLVVRLSMHTCMARKLSGNRARGCVLLPKLSAHLG